MKSSLRHKDRHKYIKVEQKAKQNTLVVLSSQVPEEKTCFIFVAICLCRSCEPGLSLKPETHYRCRRVAAAQRHVCTVTKACRCVATALPANSLPHMKSLGRWQNIFKMASFEEALINSFRMFAVLYDMSLKDYKNEKVKGNAWEKITEEMRVIGFNVSGRLTFCTSEILL